MSGDIRIDALWQEVVESDLDTLDRDSLVDDLQYAKTINGSPDPALQGIKRITISNVRREILAHKRLKKHETECPFRKLQTDTRPTDGQPTMVSKAAGVVKVVYPLRWPIAVACFSPYVGTIIDKVGGLFR